MQVTFVILTTYHGSFIEASAEPVVFTRRIKSSSTLGGSKMRAFETASHAHETQASNRTVTVIPYRTPYSTPIDPF